LAEAANQIYRQESCPACHGAKYEGGIGSILVGLPVERIQSVTRKGLPEAGMPAFDQKAISDDDLSTLADFLSSLTLQDIGVELPAAMVDHLSQAWDAVQAGDEAAVETHLKKAQEAGADAPPGVQATLKGLLQDSGKADWMENLESRLRVLVVQ
jgi:mono/diheme cytochrome c family protein